LDEADRYQIEQQLEENDESPKTTVIYSLTPEGRTVASVLFQSLSKTEQAELVSIKRAFNSIDLKRLLRYVYDRYPESASQSVIREEIC
jgi:hypothetical protein